MESLTGLVLEGGGARGAFECGAIARLYQDPKFGIQAVAGASIGAINAACLMTNKLEEDADRTQQISDYVKLGRELTAALPPAAAKSFRKNNLYTKLSKHRYVDLVRIGMLPGGFTSAEFDFSASTIDARIAEGYEATDRALRGRNGTKDAVGRTVPVGSVSA